MAWLKITLLLFIYLEGSGEIIRILNIKTMHYECNFSFLFLFFYYITMRIINDEYSPCSSGFSY